MPLLHRLGVIEKTKFQLECEKGISVEELRQSLYNTIDELGSR